ncbi:hypothetical protein QQ045_021250 [Rhodiola kirilowii]
MDSKPLHAAVNGGSTAVTPDGVIPNTYYDHSAHSSPGRTPAPAPPIDYFYSAPSSPMHFLKSSSSYSSPIPASSSCSVTVSDRSSFEFDFGISGSRDKVDVQHSSSMSSADELFLNGKIRPMNLSSHLQLPQNLAPLIDVEEDENGEDLKIEVVRGRDFKKMRDRSLRRKARSLSPLRTDWRHNNDDDHQNEEKQENQKIDDGTKIHHPSSSSSSSMSSSSSSCSRSSKRWVFLRDFMRSKSDGSTTGSRGHGGRFWSFSHHKSVSKTTTSPQIPKPENLPKPKPKEEFSQTGGVRNEGGRRSRNAIGKQRSAHEAHYAAKRAEDEEMRRKTFLPYKQGLFDCLGFNSKSYGAMNAFTKNLSSVSSR